MSEEFEDGVLRLRDGRELAWRLRGTAGPVLLRIQGTPGSRIARDPDHSTQERLGVRYLTADRPGYGGSTRKPGRGIADLADDYAQLLDFHGLDRVAVAGRSGGGPHALALAAVHPERVSAVSVIVGAAPLVAEEATRLVGINAEGYRAAEQGWQALFEFLQGMRKRLLAEGMAKVLDDAPADDRTRMADPAWQQANAADVAEALRQGAEGWTDESLAMHHEWDFDPGRVNTSVVWWHGQGDLNAPFTAAERAVARIPGARLEVLSGEGHFATLAHTEEILRELLTRT
jgi:pimeloyl-ACP methyl ester carboxylesterase